MPHILTDAEVELSRDGIVTCDFCDREVHENEIMFVGQSKKSRICETCVEAYDTFLAEWRERQKASRFAERYGREWPSKKEELGWEKI